MKNKKGFTMIELLATIIILSILMALGVVSIQKILNKAKKSNYQDFEKTLKSSTSNYLIEHTGDIPNIGSTFRINANDLINKGYLKTLKDPEKQNADCNSGSYVIVKRNADKNFNMDLEYHPCLKCSRYKTSDSLCS